jgi:predicted ATPase/DNA-binding winged helix-turn-helix (wHTH) protein
VVSREGESPLKEADAIPDAITFGPFRIVRHERRLERHGAPIPLGSRAFDLLGLLVSRPGEVVGKSELMAKAWPDLTVDESSLRFHIAQLRRALGDGQDGERYVKNVPGRGYCFVASVGRAASPQRQALAGHGQPHSSLPPWPARIIGRERDVATLAEQVSERRFVTLRGPGGIGKTQVAIAVAHQLENQFEDGIRFLDFGSLKDPNLVAITVASALHLLVAVEDPTPRLIEALRDRHLLLVLDSCEHVVEAAARLAEQIYQHAPNVFLLATSLESLEAAGEFVFELAPLEIPPEDLRDGSELVSYASARLFVECAAAAGYNAALTDTDARIVADICRKLDGIPLAIELVASRLSAHGLIEIDQLIEGRLRLAWRGRRTAPLRHQSLSAALDWSCELISPAERTVLESLSVFPGPFTLDGARSVAGDPDELAEFLRSLEQLVAKSLVTSRPHLGQARFRLLGTTRAYAAEKLAASGRTQAVSRNHARYVLSALTPRSYERGGERPGGWSHRAELLPDARAALAWAYSDAGDAGLRIPLAAVCARLFVELNLLQECRLWASRALAASENAPGDRAAKVELLWAFGHASMFTERNSLECEAALKRGLELAQEAGDRQNQFRLLSRLHALYRRTGERRRLMEVALRAESVAKDLGDSAELARVHTYLGVAHHLIGDQRLARERLQAGDTADAAIPVLPIDHFASPRGTNIMSCTNLWLLGFADRAVAVANRLVDARSNPDLAMYCAGLCFAARIYRWIGDLNALEDAGDRLANVSRKHGFAPFHAVSVALKGELHVAHGDVDEGVALLQQSLPRMLADRFELYSGAAASALVEGLAAQGRLADALASIQARIGAVAEQGDSWEMPELLRIRGELRARSDDMLESERDLLAATELAERQSALSWKLRAAISRARLARSRKATSELQRTYARFVEGFDTADLRAARDLLRELGH